MSGSQVLAAFLTSSTGARPVWAARQVLGEASQKARVVMLGLAVGCHQPPLLKVSGVSRAAAEGLGVPAHREYQLCLAAILFRQSRGIRVRYGLAALSLQT